MIDLQQHDDQLNPLVTGLLQLLDRSQPVETEETERREFFDASGIAANAAYDDDEFEYTVADLIWINPDFNPNATR